METKSLVDVLFRETKGALTRAELIEQINDCANEMMARNCSEMEVRSSFTLAEQTLAQEWLSLTYTDKRILNPGKAYEPGDVFEFVPQEYYRVVAPFQASSDGYSDLENYCLPISYQEYTILKTTVKDLEEGTVFANLDLVHYQGVFYCSLSGGTATGVLATDIPALHLIRINANPPVSGTRVIAAASVPEFWELEGIREVAQVGIMDADGSFLTEYHPRIEQSMSPSSPCRIATETLPEGVEISFIGYRWPTQVNDENDILEVPEQHKMGLLRSLVHKRVEEGEYGNSVYWSRKCDADWKEFFEWINRDQQEDPETPVAQTFNPVS